MRNYVYLPQDANSPQHEKFADTKRTGLKGKSFENIKLAVVRRAQFSRPQYLNDGEPPMTAAS
jgi:hypothetical protein